MYIYMYVYMYIYTHIHIHIHIYIYIYTYTYRPSACHPRRSAAWATSGGRAWNSQKPARYWLYHIKGLSSWLLRNLTSSSVHAAASGGGERVEILKSQLTTECTTYNFYSFDFWEKITSIGAASGGGGQNFSKVGLLLHKMTVGLTFEKFYLQRRGRLIEILKSELATDCTAYDDYCVDFWEILRAASTASWCGCGCGAEATADNKYVNVIYIDTVISIYIYIYIYVCVCVCVHIWRHDLSYRCVHIWLRMWCWGDCCTKYVSVIHIFIPSSQYVYIYIYIYIYLSMCVHIWRHDLSYRCVHMWLQM